ncbi:MAG: sulfurtransferase complex subunit TusC [Gammaproteobacteria bacterium]|nr:MAG: sulfurtransferase complex subunit TusC [Gammaproteobacteria bacterium]
MGAVDKKSVLVVVRRSPYGSSLARASLDVALAAAAFEQPLRLLFMGDGVLQLLAKQESEAIGVKNIGRLLTSLPLYDIERVYVDAAAATRYGIDLSNAPVTTQALDGPGIHQLMTDCDHVLGF